MICINNTCTNPYFNIAAEKYLLKSSTEDVFMMWQNEPSVIIGKHQNANAEVDIDFARKHQIKIARRISGGGAVYHDLGNVNLTFIENDSTGNFTKFPQMIINYLGTIGIHAQSDKRLGLTVDGLKISGSAQYIHKKTALFHASLLFSSDLSVLKTVLNGKEDEKRKYVKSVKSAVTNISEHLSKPMLIADFMQTIMNHFVGNSYRFDNKDIAEIEKIKNEQT